MTRQWNLKGSKVKYVPFQGFRREDEIYTIYYSEETIEFLRQKLLNDLAILLSNHNRRCIPIPIPEIKKIINKRFGVKND